MAVTLIVPREVYRQDALIQVTVRVQNRSHRRRSVVYPYGFCGFDAPSVNVFDDTGHIDYPPALVPWPGLPCPEAGQTLAPKESAAYHGYAVLRGKHLQLVIGVSPGARLSDIIDVATPLVTVDLVPAPTPQVTLSTSDGKVSAVIARPSGAKGRMLYQFRANCPGGLPRTDDWAMNWTRAGSTELSPECAPIIKWLAVVGWLNYPIATIDYSATGAQPLFQRAMHR